MAAGPQPLLASAAALGAAIAAAAAPAADAATLDARLEALGRAASAVAASLGDAPLGDAERRRLARAVAQARAAYARCLRRRATIGGLAAVVSGAGAYASDGLVMTTSAATGTVRRV